MENITIGQIIATIIGLTTIVAFIKLIGGWYKENFTNRFLNIEKDIETLKVKCDSQDEDIKDSKEELRIILKSQLACLNGLKQLNCNGPVTTAIEEIDNYLMEQTHK